MAMINPKEHADAYKHQEELNTQRFPPSGTYHVVNTTLQYQIIGEKRTRKLHVRPVILACIEGEGKAWVGKNFGLDMWTDFSKNANAQRMSFMGIACGQTEAWDPEDNGQLAKAICGVPYQIKIDVKDKDVNGKTYADLQVIKVDQLSKEARSKYTSSPDWAKFDTGKAERWLKEKDFSQGKGGGGTRSEDSHHHSSSGSVRQHDPFAE